MQPLKFSYPKKYIWVAVAGALLVFAAIYFLTLPVAEIVVVRRGTAVSAVYGTVRIESTLLVPVRAQNERGRRIIECAVQVEVNGIQVEFAGLDLGEVENVVDDDQQVFRG